MAIHEECGVFGVMGTKKEHMAGIVYYGLWKWAAQLQWD